MADAPARPPIRGRDRQLALIGQRLEDLRAGAGAVVLIDGAPGFGKTRFLQETLYCGVKMGIRGGHGMADPIDQVVELAPLPADAERQFAARMGATTVEVPSSHVAMVSHPTEVADLILTAADAVAS